MVRFHPRASFGAENLAEWFVCRMFDIVLTGEHLQADTPERRGHALGAVAEAEVLTAVNGMEAWTVIPFSRLK